VIWLLQATSALAGKWDGVSADVTVTKEIAAPGEVVTAQVSDLRSYAQLFPADCATDWELQERTAGVGARAKVRYTIGPMRRSLVVVISKDEPGLFELDHQGNKGFFTQVRAVPSAGGSTVAWSTFLEPPPWPFRGAFYKQVQPAWTDCHTRALQALAHAAEAADP
jgi:hypothetical protein